jgi:hypothetical protein
MGRDSSVMKLRLEIISWQRQGVFKDGCLLGCCALMMEAVSTSETSVDFYQTTRCKIPKDSQLHTRRRENQKSHQGCVCSPPCPTDSAIFSHWVLQALIPGVKRTERKAERTAPSVPLRSFVRSLHNARRMNVLISESI